MENIIVYGELTIANIADNLVSSTDAWYYLSTSATELTGGKWETLPPSWQNGKFYWQKIVTVFEDGSTSESNPVCITGGRGEKITSLSEEYYLSDSKEQLVGGTWSSKMPQWIEKIYVGTHKDCI